MDNFYHLNITLFVNLLKNRDYLLGNPPALGKKTGAFSGLTLSASLVPALKSRLRARP